MLRIFVSDVALVRKALLDAAHRLDLESAQASLSYRAEPNPQARRLRVLAAQLLEQVRVANDPSGVANRPGVD